MNSCQFIILFSFIIYGASKTINNVLETDKIYLIMGKEIFLVNLIQNEVTEELITILPMKTKFSEMNVNETMRHIPLTTQIELPIKYSSGLIKANKGDLILFKGKELILINESYIFNNTLDNDYIVIGNVENVDKLLNITSMNKSIFIWNTLNYENQKGTVKPYGYYTSLMNFFTWKVFTFICFILL